MANDAALLELARQTASAASEAREAAVEVALDLAQLKARVDRLESAERVAVAPKEDPQKAGFWVNVLDKVAEKPVLLLYAALALVIATGGTAALSLLPVFFPTPEPAGVQNAASVP